MIENEHFKHARQANRRYRVSMWISGILLLLAGLRYLYPLLFGD